MINHTSFSRLVLCALVLYIHNVHGFDWINHIQKSLSHEHIQRDVKAMHAQGSTVAKTIEYAMRTHHNHILGKIKRDLSVSDPEWSNALRTIAKKKKDLLTTLYSKENIFNERWFVVARDLEAIQDPQERAVWDQLRIVAKNTLIDFGINPRNIAIYPNDAFRLSLLAKIIEKEPSWWKRQTIRVFRGLNRWLYSMSPIWCSCNTLGRHPHASIEFNISAMSYFEPIEQRGAFGHEITHLIEGHHIEQEVLASIEEKHIETYKKCVSKKVLRQYSHSFELMADILPAIKDVTIAKKCCDFMTTYSTNWPITNALHPIMDAIKPEGSSHPLTIYRRRALTNIIRYLEYEQQLSGTPCTD